jgi:dephospho-CoA kinase
LYPSVLIIAGKPGSGKTTVAEHLLSLVPATYVNSGSVLQEYLALHGISIPARAAIGSLFLSHFDRKDIFRLLKSKLKDNGITIIDGLRFESTIRDFQSLNRSTALWYVESIDSVRLARLESRLSKEGCNDAAICFQFKQYAIFDDEQETIRSFSDLVVPNNSDLQDLKERVCKALLKNLIIT